ncbi:hypothetical protein EMIT051CA3_90064 [Pseudomonas chlororaphis]
MFIAISDRVVVVGSGLKCMAATQNPPRKASINRLRCSPRNGTGERRAHWYARCGQMKALNSMNTQTQGGGCSGYIPADTQRKPRASPRIRVLYSLLASESPFPPLCGVKAKSPPLNGTQAMGCGGVLKSISATANSHHRSARKPLRLAWTRGPMSAHWKPRSRPARLHSFAE